MKNLIYEYYYLFIIFKVNEIPKNKIHIKLFEENKSKVFILLEKQNEKLIIDRIISIQEGLGSYSLIELCKFYKIFYRLF